MYLYKLGAKLIWLAVSSSGKPVMFVFFNEKASFVCVVSVFFNLMLSGTDSWWTRWGGRSSLHETWWLLPVMDGGFWSTPWCDVSTSCTEAVTWLILGSLSVYKPPILKMKPRKQRHLYWTVPLLDHRFGGEGLLQYWLYLEYLSVLTIPEELTVLAVFGVPGILRCTWSTDCTWSTEMYLEYWLYQEYILVLTIPGVLTVLTVSGARGIPTVLTVSRVPGVLTVPAVLSFTC